MNEGFHIELERGGVKSRVTSVRSTSAHRHEIGVILDGEISAWPRGIALNLRPVGDAMRLAVDRVQRRLGWINPRRFEVEMSRRGERLRIEGVDAEALPPGPYDVQFRLSGLKLRPTSTRIQIPAGRHETIELEEKRPKQRLELNRPVADFDANTRRILQHSGSQLDGQPAAEWLDQARHSDRRRACLLNLLARAAAAPHPTAPFNRFLESVFFAEVDRIYCSAAPDLFEAVRRSDSFAPGGPVAGTHFKILSRIPGASRDSYELVTFREGAAPSMQITFARPKSREGDQTHYVDMDIDLGNPNWDLKSFAVHIGELLHPARTNHFKLRGAVHAAGAGDFLYYDLLRT